MKIKSWLQQIFSSLVFLNLEFSVAKLKYFLASRGLSQEGSKLDLAGHAFVAYEQKCGIH